MSSFGPTERQARFLWFTVCAVGVAVLVGLLSLLIWFLGRVLEVLGPVLWPLAVGGVLAYLLDPVVDFFERHRVPRSRAILIVFAIAVTVVLAVFGSVVPQVVTEAGQLARRIPNYSDQVRQGMERWATNAPPFLREWVAAHQPPLAGVGTNTPAGDPAPESTSPGTTAEPPPPETADSDFAFLGQLVGGGRLEEGGKWVASVLPRVGQWLFGQLSKVASWFGVLAGLALVPIYLFYFLLEKRHIQAGWTTYLPVKDSAFKEELVFVLKAINGYLIAFFRGQVVVAMCDGVLYTIGFLLVGLPYAVLIGFVAVFLTVVPFLGAIVTCASALIVAVVQFGDLKHPLLVLVVFAVVQNIEGFIIQPKIVGERVGLHPMVIIIALMVGTTLLGGLLGGLLAIPLAAALRVLMFRYIWRPVDGTAT